MSQRGTPGSDLGRLTIGDESDMPVTTRAAMNRQRANLAASQRASSGRQAASSSGNTSRGARRVVQVPSPTTEPAEGSDDSEESEDEEGSDDEPDATTSVLQIMAAFDSQGLMPTELASIGRQRSPHTLRLANVIAGLVRTDADLRRLREAIPVGGEFWSSRMVNNLRMRFRTIQYEMQLHVSSSRSRGREVTGTVAECLALFRTIEDLRREYFPRMQRRLQQPFLAIMIDILEFLSDDSDQFANGSQRHYAGEAFQSHTRLLSSWLSDAHAMVFLTNLHHMGTPLLRGEYNRLHNLYTRMLEHVQTARSQGVQAPARIEPDAGRIDRILQALYALVIAASGTQP